ncbi:hypothetical protein CR513_36720, partial [Mucuna pruriens]
MKDELSSKGPTLILGKLFLKTAKTKINVHVETNCMEFGDIRVKYTIFKAMKHPIENHLVFYLDLIDQLGDEYINLYFEFSNFDDFTNCDCTSTRLIPPVITVNKLQVEQKERLLQDLKKLENFYEHLVKHSALRFLLKKPPENVALELIKDVNGGTTNGLPNVPTSKHLNYKLKPSKSQDTLKKAKEIRLKDKTLEAKKIDKQEKLRKES